MSSTIPSTNSTDIEQIIKQSEQSIAAPFVAAILTDGTLLSPNRSAREGTAARRLWEMFDSDQMSRRLNHPILVAARKSPLSMIGYAQEEMIRLRTLGWRMKSLGVCMLLRQTELQGLNGQTTDLVQVIDGGLRIPAIGRDVVMAA
jgi:hypothetical protein